MNLISQNVREIRTNSVSETFEQMLTINEEDVMISISFPRYSKRTVRSAEFAKSRGAKVIAITDGELSPLVPIADCCLMAKSDMVSFVDSLVAPLSLINALILAVSEAKNKEIAQSLRTLEKIWREYDVYEGNSAEDTVYGTYNTTE